MKDILREWIEYIKHHGGEAEWGALPKMRHGKTVGKNIWNSWIRKGYIVSEYRPNEGRFFRLSDAVATPGEESAR